MNRGSPVLRHVAGALAAVALGCAARPPVHTTSVEAGTAILRCAGHADADAVLLRGTMTGWEPVPLLRDGSDFVAVLPLPPGRYEYHLEVKRGDVTDVVVPEGAERTDDGFGGENAILRVP